jgi:hypothetical protein
MSVMAMRGMLTTSRLCAGLAGVLWLGLNGCAGDPPKQSQTVTPEQVRGHADKAFDKEKQEEQGRGTNPSVSR